MEQLVQGIRELDLQLDGEEWLVRAPGQHVLTLKILGKILPFPRTLPWEDQSSSDCFQLTL
jgi:hypothetical protein